jgi:hypothetical protein
VSARRGRGRGLLGLHQLPEGWGRATCKASAASLARRRSPEAQHPYLSRFSLHSRPALTSQPCRRRSPCSLWACFNFFAGGVVGSTALARIPDFVNKPMQAPELLGYALPGAGARAHPRGTTSRTRCAQAAGAGAGGPPQLVRRCASCMVLAARLHRPVCRPLHAHMPAPIAPSLARSVGQVLLQLPRP